MIEEIKFHNTFIKQIKAWMNETMNKKQRKKSARNSYELSRRNQIDSYFIPRGFLENRGAVSEDYIKYVLKSYKQYAIMIAEQYSASSKRKIPENLRNKILMFKL